MHSFILIHCFSALNPVEKGKTNYKEYKIRENVAGKMCPQCKQRIRRRGNIKN